MNKCSECNTPLDWHNTGFAWDEYKFCKDCDPNEIE